MIEEITKFNTIVPPWNSIDIIVVINDSSSVAFVCNNASVDSATDINDSYDWGYIV